MRPSVTIPSVLAQFRGTPAYYEILADNPKTLQVYWRRGLERGICAQNMVDMLIEAKAPKCLSSMICHEINIHDTHGNGIDSDILLLKATTTDYSVVQVLLTDNVRYTVHFLMEYPDILLRAYTKLTARCQCKQLTQTILEQSQRTNHPLVSVVAMVTADVIKALVTRLNLSRNHKDESIESFYRDITDTTRMLVVHNPNLPSEAAADLLHFVLDIWRAKHAKYILSAMEIECLAKLIIVLQEVGFHCNHDNERCQLSDIMEIICLIFNSTVSQVAMTKRMTFYFTVIITRARQQNGCHPNNRCVYNNHKRCRIHHCNHGYCHHSNAPRPVLLALWQSSLKACSRLVEERIQCISVLTSVLCNTGVNVDERVAFGCPPPCTGGATYLQTLLRYLAQVSIEAVGGGGYLLMLASFSSRLNLTNGVELSDHVIIDTMEYLWDAYVHLTLNWTTEVKHVSCLTVIFKQLLMKMTWMERQKAFLWFDITRVAYLENTPVTAQDHGHRRVISTSARIDADILPLVQIPISLLTAAKLVISRCLRKETAVTCVNTHPLYETRQEFERTPVIKMSSFSAFFAYDDDPFADYRDGGLWKELVEYGIYPAQPQPNVHTLPIPRHLQWSLGGGTEQELLAHVWAILKGKLSVREDLT